MPLAFLMASGTENPALQRPWCELHVQLVVGVASKHNLADAPSRVWLVYPQLNFKAIVDGLGNVLFQYPFRSVLAPDKAREGGVCTVGSGCFQSAA